MKTEKKAEPLDTSNDWLVTAQDNLVVVQHLPSHRLTPKDAIRLAAWLIVGAEMADFDCTQEYDALEVAIATVRAVRST